MLLERQPDLRPRLRQERQVVAGIAVAAALPSGELGPYLSPEATAWAVVLDDRDLGASEP